MRFLLGGLALLPACYLAVLAGRFGFLLKALGYRAQCSEAYLDPRSRLVMFQLPILALTAVAALLLPNWGLSVLAIGLVVMLRLAGAIYAKRLAVRNMAEYLGRTEQLDKSAALIEAKKTIAANIESTRILRGSR